MAKRTLNQLSTQDLQKEINRRRRQLPVLERRRDNLLAQLNQVEEQIAVLSHADSPRGGRTARRATMGRRTRPKNRVSLGDLLVEILQKDQPKKVSEIVEDAVRAGYKTNSKNFSTIVNQTLIKDERFKSPSRGYYELA